MPRLTAEIYHDTVWNKKDLSPIDELVHPNAILHAAIGDFHGPEAMKNIVRTWLTAFPDLQVTNTAVYCDDDAVIIQWKAKGTHTGKFKSYKPTNNKVSYAGVSIYIIHEKKLVEFWSYIDMQHLIDQITQPHAQMETI